MRFAKEYRPKRTFDYEVELVTITEAVNENGFPVEGGEDTSYSVLANKMPVTSSEFYSAAQAGFTIAAAFEINSIEYQGQKTLRFEGETYSITRTFEYGDYTELYCELRQDNHD